MFENLFASARRIAEYRAAPLVEDRIRYLVHCAQCGATNYTLRSIAADQLNLCRLLDLREDSEISPREIEAAACAWSRPGGRNCRRSARRGARLQFMGHSLRWLRFVGRLEEPEAARHPHVDQVAAFLASMSEDRGWSDNTVQRIRYTIDSFFVWLAGNGIALPSVTVFDVDRFIAGYRSSGNYSRVTIHNYAKDLRAFFRYAEQRNWCRRGIASGIVPLRIYAGETIPARLDREDVLRLLATTEGERPADKRNRAILMLLITYGLRAGEVCGLELDDLNWEEETVRVRCSKPGRTHLYPLSHAVGESILRYLREVRPGRQERAPFEWLFGLRPCRLRPSSAE